MVIILSSSKHSSQAARQHRASARSAATFGDMALVPCSALCCRAAWLLCLEDDNISPDERRLLTNYRMADDRGREVIRRIAETEAHFSGKGYVATSRDSGSRAATWQLTNPRSPH